MLVAIGWIGSGLIVSGLWALGNHARIGFLGTGLGSLVWCALAAMGGTGSLVAVNAVAALLALKGWMQWDSQ